MLFIKVQIYHTIPKEKGEGKRTREKSLGGIFLKILLIYFQVAHNSSIKASTNRPWAKFNPEKYVFCILFLSEKGGNENGGKCCRGVLSLCGKLTNVENDFRLVNKRLIHPPRRIYHFKCLEETVAQLQETTKCLFSFSGKTSYHCNSTNHFPESFIFSFFFFLAVAFCFLC